MVWAVQHQWKWIQDSSYYGGKIGQEVLTYKNPKKFEEFFNVMKEIDKKEFNDLWGLNLERL